MPGIITDPAVEQAKADRMTRLLSQAAAIWIEDHPVLVSSSRSPSSAYSTVHNEFLWAAEEAYLALIEPK